LLCVVCVNFFFASTSPLYRWFIMFPLFNLQNSNENWIVIWTRPGYTTSLTALSVVFLLVLIRLRWFHSRLSAACYLPSIPKLLMSIWPKGHMAGLFAAPPFSQPSVQPVWCDSQERTTREISSYLGLVFSGLAQCQCRYP
jgi:hypothetical protein